MKKSIAFVLLIAFIIPIFSACKGEQTDIWDGSIATSFESGDGSESAPYEIKTCAQLAYLAQQINTGVSYTDKSFSLTSNLDLNNISWTPIGNGIYAFDGNFNGNGYTVSNMMIDNLTVFDKVYSHTTTKEAVAGLFGYCTDAKIFNINIDNSKVSVNSIITLDMIYTGLLIGYSAPKAHNEITNVKITKSSIDSEKSEGHTKTTIFYGGGILGYLSHESNECYLKSIHCDISVSCEGISAYSNYIGAVAGYIGTKGVFECSDFSAYLSANWGDKSSTNYAGAFGSMGISNSHIKLNNGFSEVSVNREPKEGNAGNAEYSYYAHAIVGMTYHGRNQDNTYSGQYKFSNLYGCVKPLEGADFEAPILSLYSMPAHAIYTEDNCYGALTPPEGFNILTD